MLTLVPRTSVAGPVVAGAVVAWAAVAGDIGAVVSAEAELPSGTAAMVTAKIRFFSTLLASLLAVLFACLSANFPANFSATFATTSLSTVTVAR